MDYATAAHWDRRYSTWGPTSRAQQRWVDDWMQVLASVLEPIGALRILDLGCGSGRDLVRLRRGGYQAMGLDFSFVALSRARGNAEASCFVLGDMARGLPFAASSFDAVVSNVAVHMFSDRVTRELVTDIARVTAPDGAAVLQVNSVDDRPVRNKRVVEEMEPSFVLEDDGQTMHFFSEAYAKDLLRGWREVRVEPRDLHTDDGAIFKRMLCCTAIGQR